MIEGIESASSMRDFDEGISYLPRMTSTPIEPRKSRGAVSLSHPFQIESLRLLRPQHFIVKFRIN